MSFKLARLSLMQKGGLKMWIEILEILILALKLVKEFLRLFNQN